MHVMKYIFRLKTFNLIAFWLPCYRYDVHQRRLVRGDPAAQHVLELPGSMGLVSGHERKINLNKPTKNRPHLGFNVRGGAEFGLGIYVSRYLNFLLSL